FLIFYLATPAILLFALSIPVLIIGIGILKLQSRENVILWLAPAIVIAGRFAAIPESRPIFLLFTWIAAAVFLLSMTSVSRFFNRLRWVSLENTFAVYCALTMMITGVLPCVAFFKVAYDYHENLWTRS